MQRQKRRSWARSTKQKAETKQQPSTKIRVKTKGKRKVRMEINQTSHCKRRKRRRLQQKIASFRKKMNLKVGFRSQMRSREARRQPPMTKTRITHFTVAL